MGKRAKVALVTGSSRGIGRQIAPELARKGFVVVVHGSKDSDNLRQSFETVKELCPDAVCLTADMANADAIRGMFDEIQSALGGVDVLVNNAAVNYGAPVLEMKLEDWDSLMAVNLRAVFLCSQLAGKVMKEKGGGKIINISSVHDTAPRRYYANYSTAKAGVAMLTKALALELPTTTFRPTTSLSAASPPR